jgi:VIT1/CCC1 family predicted Fe2+/Mn2+ transporter
MIGVAVSSSSTSTSTIAIAGLAGLAAGAMSMAVGEYVSVSSQRDTENADIRKETAELARSPDSELNELTHIYVQRGLEPGLARSVAEQLTAADPLAAHLRDELGITQAAKARPWQAAFVSVVSFALGAAIPLLALAVAGESNRVAAMAGSALLVLAITGGVAGRLGGAPIGRAALRVLIGGGVAMAVTALFGNLIGTAV